jgi:cation diffusion facilitator family transporter
VLTLLTMVGEIAAGTVFGSMALLADGFHMATHAAALGITGFAYHYARKRANDRRFTFGTGKVSALGGFGSAISLAVVALLVVTESLVRLWSPVPIRFDEALWVAGVGLAVNLLSALLLRHHEHADDDHEHGHRDHALHGAYLHVLADTVTSLLAIGALILGKALGWNWMDALTGILCAAVIGHWSLGLIRDTGRVLLDAEVPETRQQAIREAVERDADNRVYDLHVWRVGPRHLAAIVSLVTSQPRDPSHYKQLLLQHFPDLRHLTIEVHKASPGPSNPSLNES